MTELVLDAEQTKILAEATGPVTVRDHDGRELGVLFPSVAMVTLRKSR